MNYRALIFDDHEETRQMLWSFFDERGYEVFTFPHPAICPLNQKEVCPCPIKQSCADVILSDLNMPIKTGLLFFEEQIKKGCRCKHFALMSGAFSEDDISKGKSLGIKILKKPLEITELMDWLDQIEKHIDPKRKLSRWF
jgi:DNA-binding response OmpR family regulator